MRTTCCTRAEWMGEDIREKNPICLRQFSGGEPKRVVGGTLWKKDGSSIPVEYCERPMQRLGSRTCYVATIRDLSEIELAKEALRRSEEQYRRILESMPDVAWTSDVEGGTRYISPKVEALLGFTNQELYAGGT